MKPKSYGEPFLASYLQNKAAMLGVPIVGNFEITPRCNLGCKMCYVRQSQAQVNAHGGECSASVWKDYIRHAVDCGMLMMLITGGEPTIRPDFLDIYTYAHELGVMVSINSNGTIMSQHKFIEAFEKYPPLRINISLYGASPKTYQDLCGDEDAYYSAIETIKSLRSIGVDVKLNYTATPYNIDDMDAIERIAEELGVPVQCSTYMFPPMRRGVSADSRLTAEDSAAAALKNLKHRYTNEEYIARLTDILNGVSDARTGEECMDVPLEQGHNEEGERMRCRAGACNFWLAWDGYLQPCGIMPSPRVNIAEVGGFKNAWESIRRQVANIRLPIKCKTCGMRSACEVCAASCICESGAADSVPEYMCRRTAAVLKCAEHETECQKDN